MGRLIIDDTTVYEIDEECMRRKERQEKTAGTAEEEEREVKDRALTGNRAKERPAP